MTLFDFIFLGLLLVFASLGAWRGLVSEIIALLTWIAALTISWTYTDKVANMLTGVIAERVWQQVLAFTLIFIGVLAIAALLRYTLRSLLKAAGMGPSDRFFGVLFGLAKGMAIALILVLAGGLLGLAKEPWWEQATFSPPLETAVLAAKPWLPDAVAEHISFR